MWACEGNRYIEPEATFNKKILETDLRLNQHTQGFLQGNQDTLSYCCKWLSIAVNVVFLGRIS